MYIIDVNNHIIIKYIRKKIIETLNTKSTVFIINKHTYWNDKQISLKMKRY
jgi:hypothetical protein